ncbi:MAG TPA: OmpA family protein [Bacteroidales bacterium]|nr:OmpA family protein [Bacteroidales bacterium]
MKQFLAIAFFCLLSIPVPAQDDKEGTKDPSLFTRMPGFHIYNFEELEFNKYEFPVAADKLQPVEGHHLYYDYYANDNIQLPSGLQIARNYSNAAKKIGGQVIYEFDDGGIQNTVLKLVSNGTETWAHISAGGNGMYKVNIIEKQLMNQSVVADANSMLKSIRETGKVALYGIYFDSGKSVLKPESQTALQEISKLLKANASLKLYVVGHTDNTGSFESNIKLSNDRAAAVVNELVTKFAIDASRLRPWGDGPTAPVATNDTEAGKALNRRVELVKQ